MMFAVCYLLHIDLHPVLCLGGHDLFPVHPKARGPTKDAAVQRHPEALALVMTWSR